MFLKKIASIIDKCISVSIGSEKPLQVETQDKTQAKKEPQFMVREFSMMIKHQPQVNHVLIITVLIMTLLELTKIFTTPTHRSCHRGIFQVQTNLLLSQKMLQ